MAERGLRHDPRQGRAPREGRAEQPAAAIGTLPRSRPCENKKKGERRGLDRIGGWASERSCRGAAMPFGSGYDGIGRSGKKKALGLADGRRPRLRHARRRERAQLRLAAAVGGVVTGGARADRDGTLFLAAFRGMPTADAEGWIESEGSIGEGSAFAVGMPRKVAKNRRAPARRAAPRPRRGGGRPRRRRPAPRAARRSRGAGRRRRRRRRGGRARGGRGELVSRGVPTARARRRRRRSEGT